MGEGRAGESQRTTQATTCTRSPHRGRDRPCLTGSPAYYAIEAMQRGSSPRLESASRLPPRLALLIWSRGQTKQPCAGSRDIAT